ncbi:MAG: hypothetical protein JNK53_03850 [Phycisphaerae bacterium]|nr:hypothetical protein [Phycisphaerae bacterium]
MNARTTNARRGWALLDVIVGGVILAVGLAAVIGLVERSLAMQQRAEREMVAAQLLDSKLNEVLAIGPVDWMMNQSSDGDCDEPFSDWQWSIAITKQGLGDPYRVVAVVTDRTGHEYMVDTLMAPRLTEDPEPARTPDEPIERQERYDALQ